MPMAAVRHRLPVVRNIAAISSRAFFLLSLLKYSFNFHLQLIDWPSDSCWQHITTQHPVIHGATMLPRVWGALRLAS